MVIKSSFTLGDVTLAWL